MSKKDLPNLKDVSRIPEELIPVVEWWQERGPKTVGIAAAAILIVLCGYFWIESSKAKQDDAIVAYATLAPQGGEDTREDVTTAIIDSGAAMAAMAQLDRAHNRYVVSDYQGAFDDYDALVATLSEPAVKDIALLGRLLSSEALKHYDEALADVATLEATFAQSEVKHYLAAQVTCAKARILCLKGDKIAAKEALATLLASTDESEKALAEKTLKMVEAYDPATADLLTAPVLPLPETPVIPVAETPVAPEASAAPAPEAPATPAPEAPAAPAPEAPTAPAPEAPTAPAPEAPATPAPEAPATPEQK